MLLAAVKVSLSNGYFGFSIRRVEFVPQSASSQQSNCATLLRCILAAKNLSNRCAIRGASLHAAKAQLAIAFGDRCTLMIPLTTCPETQLIRQAPHYTFWRILSGGSGPPTAVATNSVATRLESALYSAELLAKGQLSFCTKAAASTPIAARCASNDNLTGSTGRVRISSSSILRRYSAFQ
jgi:hypothetical protein